MRRIIQLVAIAVMAMSVFCTSPVMALEDPPMTLPKLLVNRVVAGVTGQTSYEYIELYNPNPTDVAIDSWRVIVLRKAGDIKQEFTIHGTVKANGSVLIGGADTALDSFAPDMRLKTNVIVTTGGIVQLVDREGASIEQVQWGDAAATSLPLPTGNMLERTYTGGVPSLTGNTLQDFTSRSVLTVTPQSGDYVPYVADIHRCDGVIISEIAANMSDVEQFVELYNASASSVQLDGCLLQTNRSTTTSFVLNGTLAPDQYRAIYIAATNLSLTKTTTGTAYLLSSDGKEEIDIRSYDGLAEITSWSWFGGEDWRQTFAVSADAPNIWQEFLPCEVGYERNVATGRCRKIIAAEPAVECEAGKYRSLETGRCRNVEATDEPAACKEGQYRNPETNRCRSIASLASTLTPCKEGQERSVETNRCRNVVAGIPKAAFAVEPIKDTATAFAGWWALGGVGVLAVAYGAWEWRHEVANGIRKVATFFTSSK